MIILSIKLKIKSNIQSYPFFSDFALASSPDSSDVLMTLIKDVVLSRRRRWSGDDVNVPYEAADVQRPFSRRHRTGVFRSRHAPRVAFRSADTQAADRGGWGGAYGK